MPPYITNRGDIYERVSSGSFPIKDSTRLNQLYQKKKDELIRVKNIVELLPLEIDRNFPENIFAYLDFGFLWLHLIRMLFGRNTRKLIWKKLRTMFGL